MQEIKTNPTVRHTTPLQLLAAFAATVAVLFCAAAGGVRAAGPAGTGTCV